MKPFLKWAGGKRWFVSNHANLLSQSYHRYIEPFVGSGAVFFHLLPSNAILCDSNTELIDTYRAIKDEPTKVMSILKHHQSHHSVEYYYKIRSSKPHLPATKAARFIYLNRTCFNGLYRVNRLGQFNVPKGTKNAVVFPDDDFLAIQAALYPVKMYARDFIDTLRSVEENDFLFVDPPYTVQHNNNNFIKYNEKLFTWEDQKNLALELTKACKRGARVLMTNANHSCVAGLYNGHIWIKRSLTRHSTLASDINNRVQTSELVISNYLDEHGRQGKARY